MIGAGRMTFRGVRASRFCTTSFPNGNPIDVVLYGLIQFVTPDSDPGLPSVVGSFENENLLKRKVNTIWDHAHLIFYPPKDPGSSPRIRVRGRLGMTAGRAPSFRYYRTFRSGHASTSSA